MERATFLKFIQEKNDNCDPRKLSFQNLSSGAQQNKQKAVFNCDSPAFQSQLPAFINRKVKNLKPYTNHFKRFNIQTSKIPDSPHKCNNSNKHSGNNHESDKIKTAKSNLLKQLGIGREIKPMQNPAKMPQISVYQQFLQKTSNLFTMSNALQTMYQSCVNKNQKNQKETYQRTHRKNNPEPQAKLHVPKQQRQSLGTNPCQQTDSEFTKKSSKKSIKSMNQLPKNEQTLLRSDKICVIPNTLQLKHEEIFCKSEKKTFGSIKKKYSVPFKEAHNKQFVASTSSQRKKSQNIVFKDKEFSQPSDQVMVSVPGNFQTVIKSQKSERQIVQSVKKEENNIKIKESPDKYQNGRTTFNFNIGLNKDKNNKKKQQPKVLLTKNNTQATINVDKHKRKQNTEMAPPSNVTAFSYIVYEPSFSQNNALKFDEDNLKSNNKVFGNNRVLAALNCKSVVQIASLTKIMTFVVALDICEKLKIDSSCEKVRIKKFQEGINGTSAQIKEGQIYTVEQLYYGLMLPSGNDASLALATWGGKKLLIHQLRQKQKQKKKTFSQGFPLKMPLQSESSEGVWKVQHKKIVLKKKKCYQRFILEMNKKARSLGMVKTAYANSHGLSNNLNKSCAFDLCILCEHAMMSQKFNKVVSTKQYKCKIEYEMSEGKGQESKGSKNGKQSDDDNQQKPIDDVEHENEHSDEQSTQSLDQKDVQCTSPSSSVQRQKPLYLSQANSSSTKQSQTFKPAILYEQRQIYWQNTHKLLAKEEYIGIKTGITNTAGPCLASCIKTKQNRCFIIIVLNSKKLSYRFKDTEVLRKWLYKKQNLISKLPSSKLHHSQHRQQQQQSCNDLKTNQNSPGREHQSFNQVSDSDQVQQG